MPVLVHSHKRLACWDYTSRCIYMITLTTKSRESLFGECREWGIERSALGKAVYDAWQAVERRFPMDLTGVFAGGVTNVGDSAFRALTEATGRIYLTRDPHSPDRGRTIEEIARAGGDLWFQLYMWADRALSHDVIDRAAGLGCSALLVTLDLPVPPNREYLHRNGFGTPFRLNARNTLDVLAHPRWLLGTMARYAVNGGIPSQANLPDRLRNKVTQSAHPGAHFKQDNLDWDEVARLRERWPGKFVLKGILRADDAERAAAMGADAIVVSNHGGRGLDCAVASIDALPTIVEAVGGRVEIVLDSGVRRGSDVVKAVAKGASGVLAGRAALYGLAAAGEDGVVRALELLKAETSRTMAMLGARNVSEIGPDLLG